MTIAEKVEFLENFCDKQAADCMNCVFNKEGMWCQIVGKDVDNMSESELDYALSFILPSKPVSNAVNHPSHYNQGGIECIDAMVAAFGKEAVENFCMCNAFKYVWRNRDKNGFEDIDKAIWYLEKVKELCSD